MTREEFEALLDEASSILTSDLRSSKTYHDAVAFPERVREVLAIVAKNSGISVQPTFHVHAFPDISVNGFGVEVKYTSKDTWLSVGNSVFEGMRDHSVNDVWLVFGKAGGTPEARWGRYEEAVSHVRISHAPRFCVDLSDDPTKEPLFNRMGISYTDFCALKPEEKMTHVRKYTRGRKKPGEVVWWLEGADDTGVPLEVNLYMRLPQAKKEEIRAVATLLFPKVVAGSRVRDKYEGVAFFILKYFNVYCPQARDLFSAGSVAGKDRGGNYVLRSIHRNEGMIRKVAKELPDELFLDCWGEVVPRSRRIKRWLELADSYATDWVPSEVLFKGDAPPNLLSEND